VGGGRGEVFPYFLKEPARREQQGQHAPEDGRGAVLERHDAWLRRLLCVFVMWWRL